jgi:ubiquinone/menaquinone biosynthesis C-methylase UbiE
MAIFKTKVKRNYSYFNNIFYSYFLKKYREKIFKIFLENIKLKKIYKVIDIGSTAVDSMSENYFLHNYPYKKSISCFSNQKLDNLKKKYPFLIIKKGDGRNTNLPDNYYEIVHSNATIEHVGSFDNQIKFVRELYRISKKIIFMQTPNRYFPIDFHTLLPFLHWLPKTMHRKILDIIGLKFLSKESNLNLLSIKELKEICRILKINSYSIKKVKIFGLVSNLILIIKKTN